MIRFLRVLAVGAALASLGFAWPAMASVPKLVFAEDFTATFCVYCPRANCALDTVGHRNPDDFAYLETHGHFNPADPFVTAETTARINRYHVNAYPWVWFDGVISEEGANVCTAMIPVYTADLNSRLNATDGVSPIQISGSFNVDPISQQATLTANFTLVDSGSYTAHQATLYVYEDSIACCTGVGGQDVWDKVVRMVRSTPLSLTTDSPTGTVTQVYQFGSITPTVTPSHLHAFAVYEEIAGSMTILQASRSFSSDPAAAPPPTTTDALMLTAGHNPVQTEARLRFNVPADAAGTVRFSFLDAGGRVVRTLDRGPQKSGSGEAVWDLRDDSGRQLPNGFYFARMYTANGSASTKIVVMR